MLSLEETHSSSIDLSKSTLFLGQINLLAQFSALLHQQLQQLSNTMEPGQAIWNKTPDTAKNFFSWNSLKTDGESFLQKLLHNLHHLWKELRKLIHPWCLSPLLYQAKARWCSFQPLWKVSVTVLPKGDFFPVCVTLSCNLTGTILENVSFLFQ